MVADFSYERCLTDRNRADRLRKPIPLESEMNFIALENLSLLLLLPKGEMS